MLDNVRDRIARRKAELAEAHELLDGLEVGLLVTEFLCVLFALMFGVAGKASACCALMLIAIYLKMRR